MNKDVLVTLAILAAFGAVFFSGAGSVLGKFFFPEFKTALSVLGGAFGAILGVAVGGMLQMVAGKESGY